MRQEHLRCFRKKFYQALPAILLLFLEQRPLLASNQAQTWQKYSMIGQRFERAGKRDEAELWFSKALAVAEKFGEDDPRLSQSLRALADLYMVFGQLKKAEIHYERELSILERMGGNYPDAWHVLAALTKINYARNNYAAVERYAERALALREKVKVSAKGDELAALDYQLANAYFKLNKYDRAESLIQESLKLANGKGANQQQESAALLFLMAEKCLILGQFTDSDKWLKEALARSTNCRESSKELLTLAEKYSALKNYVRAEELYGEAIAIREKDPQADERELANCLCYLANTYQLQGKSVSAVPLYERALAIYKRNSRSSEPMVTHLSVVLARAYSREKEYGKAERMYKQALALSKKVVFANDPDCRRIMAELASVYVSQKRYADAEPLYRLALEVKAGSPQPDGARAAVVTSLLADDLFFQRKFADAEIYYRKALLIQERLPESLQTAHIFVRLGQTLSNQDKCGQAEPYFKQALVILEKAPELRSQYVVTLYEYADLLRRLKRNDSADQIVAQAQKFAQEAKDSPSTNK